MSESPLPDNLETFLQNPPSAAADARARLALLEHTAALLPRPRIGLHWPIVCAVAASLLIGFIAGYVIFRLRMAQQGPALVEEKKNETPDTRAPKEDLPKPAPPVIAPAVPADPRVLENKAFDAETDVERVRLYFRAGNLYLEKHDDVNSALRCYRQALAYGDDNAVAFNPDDNWLVMALKRDHRKEK